MRKKRELLPLKLHKWFVVKVPEKSIESASVEELSYLAALVDGEGNLDIARFQPRIRIGMKSLLPVIFAKRYGGRWYPRADRGHGTISYSWYIQSEQLISDFVRLVMPYSRVKQEEFQLLSEALTIRKATPRSTDWKNKIKKIGKKLRELHHMNPVVIFEAAKNLDKINPGWREWVQPGTIIKTES